MNKWLVSVVVLGSSLTLVACGNSTSTNSGTNASGSNGSSGPVTITEMDYYTSPLPSQALNQLIQQFEQSHPTIKIQRVPTPYTQLLPKSLQEAATHTLPTIVVSDNLNIPTLASAGALVPLSKFGTFDTSQYLAGPLKTVTVNGKLYGLPVGNNDLALFYNKTMFKAAHLSPPTTWSELLSDAKQLTHGSTYGIAFSAPSNEQATWQFAPFIWTNGGSFVHFDSPQSVQALKLWTDLVKEGGASHSVVNFSQTDVYNEFAAGRAAMMEMGPWELPALKQTKLDYGIVPMVTPQAGQNPISPIGGEAWTITSDATTQQQNAAWTFIKWVQQKDILANFDNKLGNIPAYKPATDKFIAMNPDIKIFADELQYAKPLFSGLGSNLPKVSDAVSTAIQSSLTGQQSPGAAAKSAAPTIASVLQP